METSQTVNGPTTKAVNYSVFMPARERQASTETLQVSTLDEAPKRVHEKLHNILQGISSERGKCGCERSASPAIPLDKILQA